MQSTVPTGTSRPVPSWLSSLDPDTLIRQVGPGAVTRGAAYARAGAVTKLGVSSDGSVLFAAVQGTRPEPYQVIVRARPDGQWSGDCSCPMGGDCKHVVAKLFTVRDGEPRVRPGPPDRDPAPAADPAADPMGDPAAARQLPAWERHLTDLFDRQDVAR